MSVDRTTADVPLGRAGLLPGPAEPKLAEPPAKLHDGRFWFSGLGPRRRSCCRLRVYRWAGMPRLVLLATELADNPGASITNAAEGLVAEAWRRFQPQTASPPLLIEHYGPESYAGSQREDNFALVEFGSFQPPSRGGKVTHPRWSYIPRSFVERLTGEEVR